MLMPLLAVGLPTSSYRIVDLGLPAGAESAEAVAINNRGEVAVQVRWRATGMDGDRVTAFTNGHGYLWRAGQFLDFGEPKASSLGDPVNVEPSALNDHSVVVGTQGTGTPVFMSGLSDVTPFLWRGKGLDDLGSGWSSIPRAINNYGDVVGESQHRGFARIRGRLYPIETLSYVPAGNRSDAIAINDHRLILGNSTYGGKKGQVNYSLPTRPFTIDASRLPLRMLPIPLPKGSREAVGLAVNNAGTVLVGSGLSTSSSGYYYVRKGKIWPVKTVSPLQFVDRVAMNVKEDVVLTTREESSGNNTQPKLVLRGREVPFPRFSGWTLQTATGINDKGQICGTGLHDGKARAYVLTPR